MSNASMHEDISEVLHDEAEIQAKIDELAQQLKAELEHKNPLVICILKGAFIFMADLVKRLDFPLEIDFMDVSSYGQSTESSGIVKIIKDLDTSVEGRHVLIVEDIIDSGLTLRYLVDVLKGRRAQSVSIVTLFDKPEGRKVELNADYTGFTLPNSFVVGYGLDYAEKYRNLPYIGILKQSVYQNEK